MADTGRVVCHRGIFLEALVDRHADNRRGRHNGSGLQIGRDNMEGVKEKDKKNGIKIFLKKESFQSFCYHHKFRLFRILAGKKGEAT